MSADSIERKPKCYNCNSTEFKPTTSFFPLNNGRYPGLECRKCGVVHYSNMAASTFFSSTADDRGLSYEEVAKRRLKERRLRV